MKEYYLSDRAQASLTATGQAIGLAFVIGSVTGTIAGLALGLSKTLNAIVGPFLMPINSIPRIALAPLFDHLVLGLTMTSKVVLAVSIVFFILAENARGAVRSVDSDLMVMARVVGLRRTSLLWKVAPPSAVPTLFAGLRLTFTYSLLGVVASEMIAATSGLGQDIVLFVLLPGRHGLRDPHRASRLRCRDQHDLQCARALAVALAGHLSRRLSRAVNLAEVRSAARSALPRPVFEIVDGGHGDDLTVRANRAAYDGALVRPRLLEDVTVVDPSTTVLGRRTSMPVLLAPCSFARMCDPGAERAVARAAGTAEVEYVVPGGSSDLPEDVARAASGSLWYQIYLKQDQGVNAELVARVAAAGYRALCVTVDTPGQPHRETDLRNRLSLPVTITPRLVGLGVRHPRWARRFLVGNREAGVQPDRRPLLRGALHQHHR